MTVYHKYLIVCWLQHTVFFSDRRENVKRTRHHTVHSEDTAAQPSPTGRHCLSAELRGSARPEPTRDSLCLHMLNCHQPTCKISLCRVP